MLAGFALLMLCQLAGEALVKISALPVPGPVVGMVLLAGLLAARAPLPSGLTGTAQALLGNLSLLFVPGWRRRRAKFEDFWQRWDPRHRCADSVHCNYPCRHGDGFCWSYPFACVRRHQGRPG